MKASELRTLSQAELDAKLLELKKELFNLRFQQAINQLDNPMRISAVRKDIARLNHGGQLNEGKKFKKNSCRHRYKR